MRVHHTGIVVEDMALSLEIYKKLGYEAISDIVEDNVQNNRLLFIKLGNEVLELIEPMNEQSTVYNAGNYGYHHICYEVEDLDTVKAEFKGLKIGKIFTEKITAPAFDNRNIMFAYLKNGTIIEYVEAEK